MQLTFIRISVEKDIAFLMTLHISEQYFCINSDENNNSPNYVYLFHILLTVHLVNEMGGACGAYGGGERCAQGSGWET